MTALICGLVVWVDWLLTPSHCIHRIHLRTQRGVAFHFTVVQTQTNSMGGKSKGRKKGYAATGVDEEAAQPPPAAGSAAGTAEAVVVPPAAPSPPPQARPAIAMEGIHASLLHTVPHPADDAGAASLGAATLSSVQCVFMLCNSAIGEPKGRARAVLLCASPTNIRDART